MSNAQCHQLTTTITTTTQLSTTNRYWTCSRSNNWQQTWQTLSPSKSPMRFTSLQLFGWGEQKLVKNNQDNQIQNITLCNMYISKKVRYIWCTMGSGTKPPDVGEFLSIFVLKVTLQPVTFLVSYKVTEKNGGGRMYYLPQHLPPHSRAYASHCHASHCQGTESHWATMPFV